MYEFKSLLLISCGSALALAASSPALAQSATTKDDTVLEAIVVTGAKPGITNIKPTATVSGLNQDIVEIPRSVTTLDSSLLKQLQVHNIHDLTTAAAGTYT
ncbi:MAG: TonB-dependent receptor, partial [Phenylobacterium sp.]|nr:TonB-dependent receptor [Phenylobacterium sp.]